jgi:hypothetical protein
MLIDAFSPGIRPRGLTDLLLAKLLGRTRPTSWAMCS